MASFTLRFELIVFILVVLIKVCQCFLPRLLVLTTSCFSLAYVLAEVHDKFVTDWLMAD